MRLVKGDAKGEYEPPSETALRLVRPQSWGLSGKSSVTLCVPFRFSIEVKLYFRACI